MTYVARRTVLLATVIVAFMVLGLAPVSGADPGPRHDTHRDVPAFQSARNRQVTSMSFNYARLCPACDDERWYTSSDFAKATGKVHVNIATFKILDQNDRYDFYALDATATLTNRTGDEDWGWMDFNVRSVGKVRVLDASYSLGKHSVNSEACTYYPIDLGVQFFFVSAGTEVGHVRFCHAGSEVSSSGTDRGRLYHATGVSGIWNIEMQRYVQVREGRLPRFRVKAGYNQEGAGCANVVDGYHCWINRAWQTRSKAIGTSRQQ